MFFLLIYEFIIIWIIISQTKKEYIVSILYNIVLLLYTLLYALSVL